MPLEIQNEALYHDRTVQDWHRRVMPRNADAIDLDLFGTCHRAWCRDPLYFIEASTNPSKPVSILNRLSRKADGFGILVVHDTDGITGFRVVYDPTGGKLPDFASEDASEGLERLLTFIRLFHENWVHSVA